MPCEGAARKLTAAMKRTIRKFDTLIKTDRTVVRAIIDAHQSDKCFYKTACSLSKWGAADSEPMWIAEGILEKYASLRIFGHTDHHFNAL